VIIGRIYKAASDTLRPTAQSTTAVSTTSAALASRMLRFPALNKRPIIVGVRSLAGTRIRRRAARHPTFPDHADKNFRLAAGPALLAGSVALFLKCKPWENAED